MVYDDGLEMVVSEKTLMEMMMEIILN